ncbi:uncharacterized protein LOC129331866 isoform X2 [Eublepharis macularius]|uniref:RNA/RNP complex-1-interacting phosphatase n=1 Tax=Eublepharis macularius TaxID=481883 RepID=A0AA97JJY9_EUBMA|nr:uncharacterized protein LOC129331866 isoform X2 [Eublepharis macularius]
MPLHPDVFLSEENHTGGWRNVSPVGQPIPGTRFIAFKVPLKGEINQRLTPNQKFTLKDLIAAVKGLNVELGLIIDLTYTTRYYNVKDLPKTVEYKKLYTVGLEVPDDPTILQFKKWVRKFLWENAENEKLIGVHCTNGINRTGYLICRYLIDVEGWDPETAIQVFGEARGHHMDGSRYLTDLKTQPMRSNLGMNIWDADADIIPLPNEMDGHIGRFPNEEFPRPEKRLRGYEDGRPHNDLPGQIQLREFDFINKGPGQRRKPYHALQFQEDLPSLMQINIPEPPFYDDYQEEMHWKDLDVAIRDSEQWQRSFRDHQFYDNPPENAPPRNLVNMGRRQKQRHFPDSDMPVDMQFNRGRGQRQRPFYDQQSNDEFQPHTQLKDRPFLNMGRGQRMRPFHNCRPHDDMQPPVGDLEFVSRGRGQRMRPFLDRQHDNELRREMAIEDFANRDLESRCRPFHDTQSYDDFSEPAQLKDFVNSGPEQKMRPFDHSSHDELSYEGYLERCQTQSPDEHFQDSPLCSRDYVSDKDFNKNYRNNCSEGYRRIRLSDEINRGEKSRFAPYPSHQLSSAHQKVSSVSADCGREPQHEISREMDREKRVPVVTIDYNYGLPLDYTSEEDDRAQYDLPSRERCIWN